MASTVLRERSRAASAAATAGGSRAVAICVTGVIAAALSALAAQAPVLLAWATDPRSTAGSLSAVRTGLLTWLLALHGTVTTTGGSLSIAPLGLTVVVLLCLGRAGANVARRHGDTLGTAVGLGACVCFPYAVVVALATGPAGSSGARPAPLRTLFATLVLAAAAGAAGGLRAYGLTRARRDVGPLVAGLVDGAVAGVLVLLAAGFAAAAAAVAFHHDRVASLLRALHPRGGGWLPLLLLGIAAAPNAAIWLTAYAAGTGFSIGVGSVVAPTGVRLDAVPAFPLLGALPAPGAAPAVSLVLLLTPLAAAVVAATVVTRRVPGLSAGRAAAWLLVVGIGAGVVVGALCWIAGGAAGPGALRAVGPSPWVTAAAVAEEVGLVGAAVAAWQIRRNG